MVFQESQSSPFWFQQVWGPRACSPPEVTILHLGGALVPVEELKRCVSDCYVYPLRRNQDPAPSCTTVSFLLFFFLLVALLFLDCLSFISTFPHSSN